MSDPTNLPILRVRMMKSLIMWNDFPFSDGMHPMLNGGGATNQLGRLPGPVAGEPQSLTLLKEMFPQEKEAIARYTKIIEQEKSRKPGSLVEKKNSLIPRCLGWVGSVRATR